MVFFLTNNLILQIAKICGISEQYVVNNLHGLEEHVLWSKDYILYKIWQILLNCNSSKATNYYNSQLSQPSRSYYSLDNSMMIIEDISESRTHESSTRESRLLESSNHTKSGSQSQTHSKQRKSFSGIFTLNVNIIMANKGNPSMGYLHLRFVCFSNDVF